MILHDDILNDVYQQKMFERAALILHKFPFRLLSKFSKESFRHSCDSQGMVFYYSKRFPAMLTSTNFYDEIFTIAEAHVHFYQSRWFDFGQLINNTPRNEPAVPWDNIPVLPPNTIVQTSNTIVQTPNTIVQTPNPIVQTPNTIVQTPNPIIQKPNSVVQKPNAVVQKPNAVVQTPNTNVQTINCNSNDSQIDCLNNQAQVQLSNNLFAILVPTPTSVESISVPSSPLKFVEPVASIKVVPQLKNDLNELNKLPEENNNKIHVIVEDEIINGNISSDSSKSDSIDEKTVSYAEVMKHSKPSTSKPKQLAKANSSVEEIKKGELVKSNRIPPSKKSLIKLPDAPYLPNNQHCAFCKNNGEEESVYRTHFVKDEMGNVKCPFLSMYICPQCKATGIKAHTISRCPFNNKNKNNRFNK